MRNVVAVMAVLTVVLFFGAPEARAGSVGFENQAKMKLVFFTRGVMRNGTTTQWNRWQLDSGHHTRIKCKGCVMFNFEIRTDGKHPVKYDLDLDHYYKLRYNHHGKRWDLFQ